MDNLARLEDIKSRTGCSLSVSSKQIQHLVMGSDQVADTPQRHDDLSHPETDNTVINDCPVFLFFLGSCSCSRLIKTRVDLRDQVMR